MALSRRTSSVGGAKGIAGWGAGPAVGALGCMIFGPTTVAANTSAAEIYEMTVPCDMTIIEVQGYNQSRGASAKQVGFNVKDDGTTILSAETAMGTDGAVAVATLANNTDGEDVAEDSALTIELDNDDLTTGAVACSVTIWYYTRKQPSTLEVGLAPFD